MPWQHCIMMIICGHLFFHATNTFDSQTPMQCEILQGTKGLVYIFLNHINWNHWETYVLRFKVPLVIVGPFSSIWFGFMCQQIMGFLLFVIFISVIKSRLIRLLFCVVNICALSAYFLSAALLQLHFFSNSYIHYCHIPGTLCNNLTML